MKYNNEGLSSEVSWKVIYDKNCNNGRYVVVEEPSGKIDDAQGYGFSTEEKAYKYGLNKYKTEGGHASCDLQSQALF